MVYREWIRTTITRCSQTRDSPLRSMYTTLLHGLLPYRCIGCGAPGDVMLPLAGASGSWRLPLDLCAACLATLPMNHHACERCGIPLTGAVDNVLICGQCQRRPPRFHRAYCALRYDYPADQLLRALKFGQQLSHGRVMAALLAQHLLAHHSAPWPECIVPVPLHVSRFRHRGYNQVREIGVQLSRLLNIPLRTDVIERVRATPEQVGLSRRERLRNLRDAFVVNTEQLPAHIAVLDDVITTGSTVSEISRMLLKHARQSQHNLTIEAWSIARVSAPAGKRRQVS